MKLWNYLMSLAVVIMSIACSGNDDPGTNVDTGLVLSASSLYILNDGNDEAVFTVTIDGKDVTGNSTIYQKVNGSSIPYAGISFKTTEAGKYVFYASYEGKLTSEITIEAVKEILGLPEDTSPEKFDGFRKRVLLTEGTSIDCNICPKMIAAIHDFKKQNTNGDAVLTVIHGVKGLDDFFTASTDVVAMEMFTRGNIGGVPATVLNMKSDDAIGVYQGDTPETIVERINTAVNTELQTESNTNISAAVSGTDLKGISVSAKVKVKSAGKYLMTIWLVEDNLTASKNQIGVTPDLASKYDFNIHNNVVRYVSSTEPIFGSAMSGKVTCEANEVLEFNHTIEPSVFEFANMQNMRVVFIVNRADVNSSKYVTDNVIECSVNNSVAFEYK